MNPSEVIEESCIACGEEGRVCVTCDEYESSCACDPDDAEIEECHDCDGRGRVEVEHCSVCREIVDNCTCDDAPAAAVE